MPWAGLRATEASDQVVERIPQLCRFSLRQCQADPPEPPVIRNFAVQSHAAILSSERATACPIAPGR